MILDPEPAKDTHSENIMMRTANTGYDAQIIQVPPPSYDFATGSSSGGMSSPSPSYPEGTLTDGKGSNSTKPSRPVMPVSPRMTANPHGVTTTTNNAVTVYHYIHPLTNEQVTTLLPPTHPRMVCLQEGRHEHEAHYGVLGVLAAIFWFPLGVGLCLLDRRVKCKRCGMSISDGLFG